MLKSEISEYMAKIGRAGGKARLMTMTKKQRSARAKKAARARWKKKDAK